MKILLIIITSILFHLSAFSDIEAGELMVHPDRLKYPPLSFSPPEPQRISLKNGSMMYLLSDDELPLVNVTAVFRVGSIHDPLGREGLAELTGRTMRSGGTRSMTSDKINETLDFIGASIEVTIRRDVATATLSVLKKDLAVGLKIFTQILREPAFEEKQVELTRKRKIARLKRINDHPDRLAFREFSRLIYRNNPRGRLPSIRSLNNIKHEDLLHFHKRFFRPEQMLISVSGDITKEEALNQLNSHLDDWRSQAGYDPPAIPLPLLKQKGGLYHIEKDSPQSVIIIGWHVPSKKSADHFPFLLADFIIGSGGFRSRIFSEIRSNQGLAYSTGSVYRAKSDYGIFFAYAMTKSQSTGQVISLIKEITEDAQNKLVAEKDLTWAINSINRGFIFSFLSADQIARQYLMLDYDGMPRDYLKTYRDNVAKVTPEEIKRVALEYLSWDEAVVLVVGSEKDFDKPLSHFGEVIKLSANVD